MTPIELMLSGAVATLSTCVAYMFAQFQISMKEIKAALKDCEDDREKLWARLAGLPDGGIHKTAS